MPAPQSSQLVSGGVFVWLLWSPECTGSVTETLWRQHDRFVSRDEEGDQDGGGEGSDEDGREFGVLDRLLVNDDDHGAGGADLGDADGGGVEPVFSFLGGPLVLPPLRRRGDVAELQMFGA